MKLFDTNRCRRLAAPLVTWGRRHSGVLSAMRWGRGLLSGTKASVWKLGPEIVDSQYQIDFRSMIPAEFSGEIALVALDTDPAVPAFHRSLEMLGLKGRVIDPTRDDFHDRVLDGAEPVILGRPCHDTNQRRQMFWEKLQSLYELPERNVFPSSTELRIYEAKRELAYFLKLHRVAHPETHVFHVMEDALEFARTCPMPQVFKTNTGASGSGIEILRDRKELISMIREVFLRHYISRSMQDYRDINYGYLILQEFLSPVREFRVIKIGESWFGHEKLPGSGSEIMSGSGANAWTPPPHDLLDLCHDLAERFGFTVMCFDMFRSGQGPYLVNELQTWFGSYDNSQMYIDGTPGRYVRASSGWVFEPGYFNQLRSLPLILTSVVRAAVRENRRNRRTL